MKKNINIFTIGLIFLSANCIFAAMRVHNPTYKIYHEKYGKGGVVNSRSIDSRYISAGCEDSPVSSHGFSSNRFLVVGYLFPLGVKGLIPLDLLIDLVGLDRYDSQLSWSNTNDVPRCDIWASTNKYYTEEESAWFQLSANESSPFIDLESKNNHSVFYRIINTIDNSATSSYDVGKMDIVIPSNTVGWISFPFTPQSTCQSIEDWFGGRFEARLLSDFNFPQLIRQVEIGSGVSTIDYYINDFGNGETNFFSTLDLTNLVNNIMYLTALPSDHPGVNAPAFGMVPTNFVSTTIPYQTVPWVGYPYPTTNSYLETGITSIFDPPTLVSEFNYDKIARQVIIGSGSSASDYYINDFGNGETNFFGSYNYVLPGHGMLIDFSTIHTGTNIWKMINTINNK